ncbi:type IV toxin-antitoxin system AbiEi family antitoxin [Winogradskya consettensis]|uniref:type IV toxin-antitoxin system AbiEi family antitoxin n=1 Tax=Winogradskya consettensis TaxID=113560 RepID=UPI001BB438B5|nr:type IV toxin-antitoxin system AbiEi family antitoxin [Actinoplanes consettensis]
MSEVEVVRRAAANLASRLPRGWSIQPVEVAALTDGRIDALYQLTAPDGRSASLVVEAKTMLDGRDVGAVGDQLMAYAEQVVNGQGILAARYLSPQVREQLAERGLSFVDTTGNIRLEVTSPGLFIADRGADGDPWRGPGRPRGTLKGVPAARIVRAIADFARDWTIRELVTTSGASTGAAYRVIDFLEREGLAERGARGAVTVPRWDKVLLRWSDDYSFVENGRVTRWIAPRGLEDLVKRLPRTEALEYALTGTLAAAQWAPHAPARSAMIYTADAGTAAAQWDLRPADAGANVMLAEPAIDVPFVRTSTNADGVRIAAPTQVFVDLMTGPGRSPQEAEELLHWMVANEQAWRS